MCPVACYKKHGESGSNLTRCQPTRNGCGYGLGVIGWRCGDIGLNDSKSKCDLASHPTDQRPPSLYTWANLVDIHLIAEAIRRLLTLRDIKWV